MITNSCLRRCIPILVLLTAWAGLDAQTVSGQYEDAPMAAVIRDFEQQTSLSFVYEKGDIAAAGTVTADFDDIDFRKALDRIFAGKNLGYAVNGKLVTIYSSDDAGAADRAPVQVEGVITDMNTGEPVIGASVMEKGTSNGAVSDLDGRFILQITPGSTLVFSCIGYEDYEYQVNAVSSDLKIRMKAMHSKVFIMACRYQLYHILIWKGLISIQENM